MTVVTDPAATPAGPKRGDVVLELAGVHTYYGKIHALQGVDLTVREGEIVGLIGPNGAGKTTLFNLISGEIRPTEGSIAFQGADVTALPPHQRAARGIEGYRG
jgi:ABC-type branched-subunit amino acid transport system ATPase component